MRHGQPRMQRNLGALVKRANGDRERLKAGVALVEAGARRLALHERGAVLSLAMRANWAIRPNPSLKPLAGSFFVVKDRV